MRVINIQPLATRQKCVKKFRDNDAVSRIIHVLWAMLLSASTHDVFAREGPSVGPNN